MGNRAILYLACLCLAFLAMEVWREWTGRDAAIRRAHMEMANLASSLRQHADDTFQFGEVVLTGVVQRFESEGFSETAVARAAMTMKAALTPGTRIQGLYIFDAEGDWVVNSVDAYPAGATISDRPYFKHHQAYTDRGSHFSWSLTSRTGTDEKLMAISRRINAPDGSFAGVAVVAFSARGFADYYRTFRVGDDGAISLLSKQGEIISRMPYDERVIGTDVSRSPYFRHAREQRSDSFRFVSPVDNIERLGGYSISDRYPIMVMASKSASEATAEWFQGALQRAAVALAVLILAVVLGLRLIDQINKRRASETALSVREAEFRMLAENGSDMIERFEVDGTRRYTSPASYDLLGYRPEELVGKSAFDLVAPEDMPIVVAATERMRSHTTLQETITTRIKRKDGRLIWVEASLRLVLNDAGEEVGVIVSTRDATERKEAELHLAAMANSDGLTGLQNRRAFDQALSDEIVRGRRTRTPLSLLLVDVDRFKLFNDEYGHMAGDACLTAIADVIQMAARRGGDVAARYGGEELVLLLPDTNSSAAAFVAGELCRQIEALSIPHALNAPWGVATVSIGVSTIENRRDDPERQGDWLVSTADMALYQAKGDGRNRARSAPGEVIAFNRDAG